jgi:two-component system sensor histidine kinase KdpD
MADARRMEQVLTNLVANAVKFSDEKGEVEVRGSPGEDEVMVEVMDRGRGIDPEKVDRIFDPFFQEDFSIRRPYPGVGLGLHVCRQLVVAHGGRIWAENREGGGARFVFTLPLRAGEREGGV